MHLSSTRGLRSFNNEGKRRRTKNQNKFADCTYIQKQAEIQQCSTQVTTAAIVAVVAVVIKVDIADVFTVIIAAVVAV